MWIIKHTADDYKTGVTYGERPSLPLTVSLTDEIDDFIERWQPSLVRDNESPWAAITSRAEVEAAQDAAPDMVEVGVVSRTL